MDVKSLFYYPIKGLTAHELPETLLHAGRGIPGDRAMAFAFEHALSTEGRQTSFLDKDLLAVQNDWPGLALLDFRFDASRQNISVFVKNSLRISADCAREDELKKLDQFMTEYLQTLTPSPAAKNNASTPVKLVGSYSSASRFPDREKYHVSIINHASLDALSESLGAPVDVRRFRGNIILNHNEPWHESKWIGKTMTFKSRRPGNKDLQLKIKAPIARCLNVEVNPLTGVVDLPILSTLVKIRRKAIFGVLATVIQDGVVSVGDQGIINEP